MNILIVGAGPAGARLAIYLAKHGIKVTLVERLKSSQKAAFSSAAIPIKAIKDLSLPKESISSYWNTWQIFNPNKESFRWESNKNLGVVLDFGIFRKELWKSAINSGVELLLGATVKKVQSYQDYAEIEIRSNTNGIFKRKANWVIDATGNERNLLGNPNQNLNLHSRQYPLIKGAGVEWVLQTNSNIKTIWRNSLTFFLGTRWVRHGYCWIFPMSDNRLKVGVCTFRPPGSSTIETNEFALNRLINEMQLKNYSINEKHGGILSSTIYKNEPHLRGRIIGVGDAISTGNLLGGEGIRFASISADILGDLLVKSSMGIMSSEKEKKLFLHKYKNNLSKRLGGWRWVLSNRIGRKTWWDLSSETADKKLVKLIRGLDKNLSADEISQLLFYYKFERYGLRVLPYILGLK